MEIVRAQSKTLNCPLASTTGLHTPNLCVSSALRARVSVMINCLLRKLLCRGRPIWTGSASYGSLASPVSIHPYESSPGRCGWADRAALFTGTVTRVSWLVACECRAETSPQSITVWA
jgi:hypothetical protein